MDRFSNPFLSSVPRTGFFYKNERIVAPLPGHQSLIPLSSCSIISLCSGRRTNEIGGKSWKNGMEDTGGAFESRLC